MRLIIVSGLSGSGKSVALHMLEDLDYYCIDNIPAGLLKAFVASTIETADPVYARTAVGVDARNRPSDLISVPELARGLRNGGVQCEVLFLYADDEMLLRRYSESRRRHPLSRGGLSLREAIARERELLEPIVDAADLVIDTTRTSVHELREIIRERVDRRAPGRMSLTFESFGYKHGIPADADIVLDARCLPNPYWEPSLRGLTGRDQPVIAFLEADPLVAEWIEDHGRLLERWVEAFSRTNRAYLTVAIGCTGGQHRSVYLTEALARRLAARGLQVLTRHIALPTLAGAPDSSA